jgi:hypothetical protein
VIKVVSFLLVFLPCVLSAQDIVGRGRVVDPWGNALPNATVQIADRNQVVARTKSDADGKFLSQVRSSGELTIKVDALGFRSVSQSVSVRARGNSEIVVSMSQLASHFESVTVTADVNGSDVLSPDPGEKVFVRQDLLDANPGRPGAPISIPGYPIETASGGIKAPQYFAPPELREITASRLLRTSPWAVTWCPIICRPMLTAMAIPIRMYSFRRFWKVFKSMVGPLTFEKGITPSTSRPRTDFGPA